LAKSCHTFHVKGISSQPKWSSWTGKRLFVAQKQIGWAILALLLMAAASSEPARAQVTFGSVVGNVTDATGAAVPGAIVKITEMQTNESRTVQTNESGGYTISTVPPGTYQVEIAKTGFRGFLTSN